MKNTNKHQADENPTNPHQPTITPALLDATRKALEQTVQASQEELARLIHQGFQHQQQQTEARFEQVEHDLAALRDDVRSLRDSTLRRDDYTAETIAALKQDVSRIKAHLGLDEITYVE